MKRLWVLACALLRGLGCTAADKAQWDEALRELPLEECDDLLGPAPGGFP